MADSTEESPVDPIATDGRQTCLNQCGYFGSPEFRGYCSKCYKSMSSAEQGGPKPSRPVKEAVVKTPSVLRDPVVQVLPSGEIKPITAKKKVEERREKGAPSTAQRGTIKLGGRQISGSFLKAPFLNRSSRPGSPGSQPKAQQKMSRREGMLTMLKKPQLKELADVVQSFVSNMRQEKARRVEECSQDTQQFYETVAAKFTTIPVLKTFTPEQMDNFMDDMERYVMAQCYLKVFCMPSSDEFGKDWYLSRKIALLWWVEPSHFDIVLDYSSLEVTHKIEQAKGDLTHMDMKRAPVEKLNCLCKACDHIFSALKVSTQGPASADDFLPALIYVIISCNPPRLHSNINYIERFGCPSRVTSGETGYHFTNLFGAVAFIDRLDHESLNMSEEQFNSKMGIKPGKTVTDAILANDHTKGQHSKILEEVEAEMQVLRSLCADQRLLQVEVGELRQEIAEFKQGVAEQVDGILAYSGSRATTYWGGLKPSQVTADSQGEESVDITVQPAKVGPAPSRQGKVGTDVSGKASLSKEEVAPPVPEKKRKQQTQ